MRSINRHVVAVLGVSVLFGHAGLAQGQQQTYAQQWTGEVVRVVGGNTIEVRRGSQTEYVTMDSFYLPGGQDTHRDTASQFSLDLAGRTVQVEVTQMTPSGRLLGRITPLADAPARPLSPQSNLHASTNAQSHQAVPIYAYPLPPGPQPQTLVPQAQPQPLVPHGQAQPSRSLLPETWQDALAKVLALILPAGDSPAAVSGAYQYQVRSPAVGRAWAPVMVQPGTVARSAASGLPTHWRPYNVISPGANNGSWPRNGPGWQNTAGPVGAYAKPFAPAAPTSGIPAQARPYPASPGTHPQQLGPQRAR